MKKRFFKNNKKINQKKKNQAKALSYIYLNIFKILTMISLNQLLFLIINISKKKLLKFEFSLLKTIKINFKSEYNFLLINLIFKNFILIFVALLWQKTCGKSIFYLKVHGVF